MLKLLNNTSAVSLHSNKTTVEEKST